jgi:hypothetical protein
LFPDSTDFVFALAWVTVVFDLLPGVIAYFGFFWSLEAVRAES